MVLDLVPMPGASCSSGPPTSVMYIAGEVDMATVPMLHAAIEQSLVRPVDLIVDLAQVTYLDSSAMSVLVDVRRTVMEAHPQSTLSLAGLTRNVQRLLTITRLLPLFTVANTAARPDSPLTVSTSSS